MQSIRGCMCVHTYTCVCVCMYIQMCAGVECTDVQNMTWVRFWPYCTYVQNTRIPRVETPNLGWESGNPGCRMQDSGNRSTLIIRNIGLRYLTRSGVDFCRYKVGTIYRNRKNALAPITFRTHADPSRTPRDPWGVTPPYLARIWATLCWNSRKPHIWGNVHKCAKSGISAPPPKVMYPRHSGNHS